MKKIFLLALMFVILILVGCGNKYSDETLILKKAGWVENEENARDFLDALETNDDDFLTQQIIDGKIKIVDKETKIAVLGDTDNGKIVNIKFSEGRYKNNVGYTLAEYIKDVGKERELEKRRDAKRKAAEEKKLADEKARLEKLAAAEKEQFKQLAEQNPQSSDIDQIVCTMAQGTDAYQKLIGTTNLPEDTA